MFPIRDHNPSQQVPYVTYGLMAVNIAVYLLALPLYADPVQLQRFFYQWALVPAAVSEGYLLHGFFTSMFLHGGLMHLAGNMLFLWIFGDNLEEDFGRIRFLAFYIASGLAAAFAQYFFAPFSRVPMVGASGAIAGVMGGYLLMYPKARVDVLLIFIVFFRIIPVPAWLMLGLWFLLQAFSGAAASGADGGVAYWAHTGGFLAGLAMALPVWLAHGGFAWWRMNDGKPPHPEATYRQSRIPVVRRRR